jgi:D-glycero-alpha-D-manno-heptose-7-phosphate kinase
MIVSKTPLRMSFVGGGSDLPAYYNYDEGAVLSTTIDKYMYIIVNSKFDGNIRLSYSITEDVDNVDKIKHPIVRNTLKMLEIPGGIEIASMADIPSKGSGLGSSSSYTVGLLNALYVYKKNYINREDLGKLACHVEIDLCKEPIGKQDQYIAAFGGLNLIRFYSDESVSVEPIICKPEIVKKLEESILIFYTGRTRSASTLLREQSKSMDNSVKRTLIKEMVKLAFDLKYILENEDLDSVGELLDKNWRLKSQLVSGISDIQIDDWYQRGIKAGAKGGKLLGAGYGGFLMFFVPLEKQANVIKALSDLKIIPFSFDNSGSEIAFNQPNTIMT